MHIFAFYWVGSVPPLHNLDSYHHSFTHSLTPPVDYLQPDAPPHRVRRGSKPSINVDLRKTLSLYANVVHSFNVPGIASRCVAPH